MSRAAMKLITFALVIASYCLSNCTTHAQSDRIVAHFGPGAWPQWSPDGNWISFVRDGHLYVVPSDASSSPERLTAFGGRHYVWSSDSELVVAERMNEASDSVYFRQVAFHVDSVQEAGGRTGLLVSTSPPTILAIASARPEQNERIFGPARLPDGTIGYFVQSGASSSDPGRFRNLYPEHVASEREMRWPQVFIRRPESSRTIWGDVWLSHIGDSENAGRPLTSGGSYGLVSQSPQGDKFIARDVSRGCYVVFDTTGRVITSSFGPMVRLKELGVDEGSSGMKWSPNGTLICFMRTRDDGHEVLDRRLMISDIGYTDTMTVSETGRSEISSYEWSPTGDRIAVGTGRDGLVVIRVDAE